MMNRKTISVLVLLYFLLSCTESKKHNINKVDSMKDSIRDIKDTMIIGNKPVSYYIENKNCSQIAVNYYNNKFVPSDNDTTELFLKLVLTRDTLLRPFYFWCINDVIKNADGALMEYVGIPARRYVEKYPEEFFSYIEKYPYIKDTSNWMSAINYSGYDDNEDAEQGLKVIKNFTAAMMKNCRKCNAATIKKINEYAVKCFGKED